MVARRVATNRIVSITDPEARSSHKNKSHAYKGFKVHVLGDVVSGLIASVSVTPANVGDGRVVHRLIRRARVVFTQMDQVLGDTAYCGAELRVMTRALLEVDILAPPQPPRSKPGRFGATDFDVDVAGGAATCPAGKAWGLQAAEQQVYLAALGNNLALLAKVMTNREDVALAA